MGLANIDLSAALTRLAERRIEEAMEAGKFENLAGMGKPLPEDPMPADENARMLWWAMRIFRQNDVLPDEVVYRKRIESLKALLYSTRSEAKVRELVKQINEVVYKLNTMGTNVRATDVTMVSEEMELARLRLRLAGR